jgi:opacity protein-like surface antigen
MREIKLTLALITFTLSASAQDFHINLFGGAANYAGDLQSKSITLNQALFTVGAGISYEYSNKLMLRAGIHFAQLNAQDKYQSNNLRRLRNLSFATNLWEVHTAAEFHFLGMQNRVFSPYVMGGVAVFNYNPYAYAPFAAGGQKVFLRPLSTEGQGLTGTNKPTYSLTQIAIPFGVGVRMKLNDRIGVGAEFGYRKTFTDYIDDVSGTYVDRTILLTQRSPLAVQMAFRTPELPGHTTDSYPLPNTVRGGSAKDNFYFMGFTISYRLSSGSGGFSGAGSGGKRYRSKMGCPTNVW